MSKEKDFLEVQMLYQKQIADLEAKLAEKDSAEQSKYQNVLELTKMCTEKDKKIEQLKQQLAEKEDELTGRKKLCDLRYDQLKQAHQEKIEFAVEQLTLFKNTIVNKMNNPYSVNIKHILSDFDNQIKQLKEME